MAIESEWGEFSYPRLQTLLRTLKIALPILDAELEEEIGNNGGRPYVLEAIFNEMATLQDLVRGLERYLGDGKP